MKVVAVSGGIDSVVLLDKMKDENILVAHFNHQARISADSDESFVKKLAKKYRKPFISAKLQDFYPSWKPFSHLSEEVARKARYQFLFDLAKKENGNIYTAHHLDDLVETVAINLIRGTGWRGLTPFYDRRIIRPLIENTKQELVKYAAEKKITFCQDPTNNEPDYLRNRIREKMIDEIGLEEKQEILRLYKKQITLREEMEQEIKIAISKLKVNDSAFLKMPFYEMEDAVAVEILKTLMSQFGILLTYPQLNDFLDAIRNFRPQTYFNLPKDHLVKITKSEVVI